MMKMTRKMAAMVAAMMAVSSIGAVNAFAETTPVTSAGASASVDLMGNVTYTPNITDNDIQPVWSIEVETSALVWDVTVTPSGTNTITWNPQTQSYNKVFNAGSATAVVNGEATKNISVTNKSNFNINTTTTIALEDGGLWDATTQSPVTNPNEIFTVNDITSLSGALNENNTGNISITLIKPGTLMDTSTNDNTQATKNATATISFNMVGEVYGYSTEP